jgi:hypothetical protein
MEKRKEVQDNYNDMIEWLMFLYEYPQSEPSDEIFKSVNSAFFNASRIAFTIEKQTVELGVQRREIEERLIQKNKEFIEDLEGLKVQIDKFKDHTTLGRAPQYVLEIEQINKDLKQYAGTAAEINAQEKDLDYSISEFPQIALYKKNIAPFEQLWSLYGKVTDNLKIWEESVISTLDPEDVRVTHKKLMATASNLENTFEQNKMLKVRDVAKNRYALLKNFSDKIPVIRCLCTEGLKEDHIAKMAKRLNMVGTDITAQPLKMLDAPEKHVEFLDEVSDFAAKQY